MDASQVKVSWEGEVVSVQPRSTVWRYLVDNRTHREIGYNVFVKGGAVGIGDALQSSLRVAVEMRMTFALPCQRNSRRSCVSASATARRARPGRRCTRTPSLPIFIVQGRSR